MRNVIVGCVLLLALGWVSFSHAQITTGTISGTVADTSGAVIPGAQIALENQDTGVSRSVVTDSAGRYNAPLLSLGNYKVTVTMQGFQTETRSGIVLTVGREAVVDIKLQVGTVAQTVEVTGEAPLVQTTEGTISYLVNSKAISDMPLNGRDMSQLILLNPNVAQAENGGVGSGSAYQGWAPKIAITGSRSEDSAFLLDGTYINDMNHHIPSGPSGALLGVETTREFQVLTNAFGAQYGRTLGGVYNAVSKSGTNELHGDIYEYLRNSDMDARSHWDNTIGAPPFKRNQFGVSLGGPIKKDKTFFFVNYEGLRSALDTTIISNVPTAAARLGNLGSLGTVTPSPTTAPFVALYPLPTPGGRDFGNGTAQFFYQGSKPSTDNFGMVRIDHQISDKDSLFGRFIEDNANSTTPLAFPVFTQLQQMTTRFATVSETHIFSPKMLATTHISYNRVDPHDTGTYPPASDSSLLSFPGAITPSGISVSGGLAAYFGYASQKDWFTTNRFTEAEDINLTLGSHALQFGGSVERLDFNENFYAAWPLGEWFFTSLSNFITDNPFQWRGTPPSFGYSPIRGFRQDFFAGYIQDDWKLTPRLTLNIGLRWEPYTVPTEVNGLVANQRQITDPAPVKGNPYWQNKSWGDLGPRFGFAYSPFASGKTAVRGGFGIIYMPEDPPVYRTQATRNGTTFPEYLIPATNASFPNAIAAIQIEQALGFNGANEGIPFTEAKSPRTYQYNFNVQQQVGPNDMFSVGISGARGVDWTGFGDYNAPPMVFDGTSLASVPGATLINPRYTELDYYCSCTNSWYNALVVNYQHRFSRGLQAALSYTWSKNISEADGTAKTDYSGQGNGYVWYPDNLQVGKGLSGFDVPQVLRINYTYDLPAFNGMKGVAGHLASGWQFMGIIAMQTGQPFSPTAAAPTTLSSLFYTCCRPNLNPNFTGSIVEGDPKGATNQYFNPAAFLPPVCNPGPSCELGNLGRNVIFGPGLASWDFGLSKDNRITERWDLVFRAETFNLLNSHNYGPPSGSLYTAPATPTSLPTVGAPVASAGSISSIVASAPGRQIQLSLKLIF